MIFELKAIIMCLICEFEILKEAIENRCYGKNMDDVINLCIRLIIESVLIGFNA